VATFSLAFRGLPRFLAPFSQRSYRTVSERNSAFVCWSSKNMATNGNQANGGHQQNLRKRGAFIVFEGLDKSGKTTQSKILVERLNQMGVPSALVRFPTREGAVGQVVDKYLRKEVELTDETIHLLFSADRWETKRKLLDQIERGVTLIVDRYAYSGIVFSAAKGLDFDWCVKCDSGLPAPDRVLFLNVSEDVALQRQGFGDERYEKTEFQNRVRKQYLRLMQQEKEAGNEWTIIDADKPFADVQEEIFRAALPLVDTSTELNTSLASLFT